MDGEYVVELVSEDGATATHGSYHTTKEAAEAEALTIWNPS